MVTQTQYNHPGGTIQFTNFHTDANGRRTDAWLQSTSSPTDNSGWSAHTHYTYDTSNRVTGITADKGPASGPAPQLNITYSFDPSTTGNTCQPTPPTPGDRSKLQSSVDHLLGQTTIYCYDTSNRLVKMAQTGGTGSNNTYSYVYDVRGNRTSAVVTGATPSSQSFTYNAANQITTTGYSYDGAGNLTATPTATYTYNGAEQMTQAVTSGVTSTYTYAGASQNQVLSEAFSGKTYQLTYGRTDQSGNPVIEGYKVGSGQAYVENDPVTGQANMLRSSSGIACLYVWDGIGNPVALITDFYATSYSYTYDPYGLPTLTGGGTGSGITQNPYLFKGGIQDRATGLVKFGQRWYDPTTGRWTQQDTLDAPLDPANANRYTFAGDDPINDSDPSGLDASLGDYAGSCLVSGGIDVLVGLVGPDWTGVGLGAAFGLGCLQGVASTAIDDATSSDEGTDADISATGIELGLNLAERFPL